MIDDHIVEDAPQESGDTITTNEDKETVSGLMSLQSEAAQADGEEAPQGVEEAQEAIIETSALLMGALSPLFDIFAPNWEVAAQEKQALCEAYGAVLDKYFPDGVGGKYATELTALTITGMIVAPRVGQPRKKPDPKTEKPAPKETQEANFEEAPASGSELGAV